MTGTKQLFQSAPNPSSVEEDCVAGRLPVRKRRAYRFIRIGVRAESKALLLCSLMNSLLKLRFLPRKESNVYPKGAHAVARETL
jgi:hypothetical protein